jgi:hypothetical protein
MSPAQSASMSDAKTAVMREKKKSAPAAHIGVRRRLWLWIGGVVLVLALAGGAAAYFHLLLPRHAGSWKLPVDARQLPPRTDQIVAEVLADSEESDASIRRAYSSAELGVEICRGGSDPARQLEQIATAGADAARQFFKPANLDAVRALLECGGVFADGLEAPFRTTVSFADDGGSKQEVRILTLKLGDLPPKFGYTEHAFGSVSGLCRTGILMRPNASSGECTASSDAALHQGSTWFLGKRSALEAIAKTLTAPKSGDLSPQVSALNDAVAETEGLGMTRIQTQIKTAKMFFAAPCFWGAFQTAGSATEFVSKCFPDSADKALEALGAKLSSAAYELEPDLAKTGAVHGNIVLVGKDADTAKDIERDANDVLSAWRSHLKNGETAIYKQAKNSPGSLHEKKFAAVVDNFVHALEDTTVSRKDRTVRLTFRGPLDPNDVAALADADKQTHDKRAAVADVLAAIADKKKVPEPSLAKLVGAKWATYLAQISQPQADAAPTAAKTTLSTSECNAAKKAAASFKPGEMPGKDASSLLQTLASADCTRRPPEVPETTRTCLVAGFKTSADFAKCAPAPLPVEPPESDYGK